MNRAEYQEECIKVYLREEYEDLDACDIEFVNSIKDAFSFGIKCADAMPKSGLVDLSKVWHPAEEEPFPYKDILTEKKKGFYVVCSWHNDGYGWKSYAKIFQLKRWAYIDDLLPKGGENGGC